jgi:hypothetical protein
MNAKQANKIFFHENRFKIPLGGTKRVQQKKMIIHDATLRASFGTFSTIIEKT